MDRTIEVKVNGSYLELDNRRAGVQYEANANKLHITFDENWAGCAKTVTFWNALKKNPVKRILTVDLLDDMTASLLTYTVPIPPEAMDECGMMSFVIDGWTEGVYSEPEDVMTLILAVTLEVVNVDTIAVEPLTEEEAAAITGCLVYINENPYTIEEAELVKGGFTIIHLDRKPVEEQGTVYGVELPVKTQPMTLVAPVRQRSVWAEMEVEEAPFEPEAEPSVDPTPTQAEQLQAEVDNLLGDVIEQTQIATNQAGVATDKAAEALSYAEQAGVHAESAADGANLAQEWANKSVDAAGAAQKAQEEAEATLEELAKNENAQTAKSYAVGGTGTRTGEDTDNSKYYAQNAGASAAEAKNYMEQAKEVAGGEWATEAYVNQAVKTHDEGEAPHAALWNVRSYSGLEQIGIATGEETIEAICRAMPKGSTLAYEVGDDHASHYPTKPGIVEFHKTSAGAVSIRFTKKSDDKMYGSTRLCYSEAHFAADGTFCWTGWKYTFDVNNPPSVDQITEGTFAGAVAANDEGQDPGTSLLRNSKLVSAETNPTVNGEICWTYE